MNELGQAAITDAMYLMIIVSMISVAVFGFSVGYGSTVSNYISTQYRIDYATSALKTILYTHVSLSGEELSKAIEIDYLLTVVKQDYAVDEKFSEETKILLKKQVSEIMASVSPSNDYLFSIQETQDDFRYLYVYMYVTNFRDSKVGGKSLNCGSEVRGEIEFPSSGKIHREYFCTAKSSLNFQRLIGSLGDIAQANSGISLAKASGSDIQQISSRAELKIWTPSCIPDSVIEFYDKDSKTVPSIEEVRFDDPSRTWYNNGNGKIVCKEVTS